jgi:hypothetical protein
MIQITIVKAMNNQIKMKMKMKMKMMRKKNLNKTQKLTKIEIATITNNILNQINPKAIRKGFQILSKIKNPWS